MFSWIAAEAENASLWLCSHIQSCACFWPGFQRCWGCVNTTGGIRVHIFNKVSWKKAEKIRNSEKNNFLNHFADPRKISYSPEKYSAKSVCHKTHLLLISSTGLLLLHQPRAWWSRSQTCFHIAIAELNKGVVVHIVFFVSRDLALYATQCQKTTIQSWICNQQVSRI